MKIEMKLMNQLKQVQVVGCIEGDPLKSAGLW